MPVYVQVCALFANIQDRVLIENSAMETVTPKHLLRHVDGFMALYCTTGGARSPHKWCAKSTCRD